MLVSVCHDNGYKFQNIQARSWPGGSRGKDSSEILKGYFHESCESVHFLCVCVGGVGVGI